MAIMGSIHVILLFFMIYGMNVRGIYYVQIFSIVGIFIAFQRCQLQINPPSPFNIFNKSKPCDPWVVHVLSIFTLKVHARQDWSWQKNSMLSLKIGLSKKNFWIFVMFLILPKWVRSSTFSNFQSWLNLTFWGFPHELRDLYIGNQLTLCC